MCIPARSNKGVVQVWLCVYDFKTVPEFELSMSTQCYCIYQYIQVTKATENWKLAQEIPFTYQNITISNVKKITFKKKKFLPLDCYHFFF